MQSKRNLHLELKKAIENNDSEQIKALIELKVSPDASFDSGANFYFPMRTAVIYAIDHKKTAALKTLLETKANPNLCIPPHTREPYSNYRVDLPIIPLSHALGNLEITQLLLEHGAEIFEEDLKRAEGNQYHSRDEALLKLLTGTIEKREYSAIKAEIVNTFNFFSPKMNMPDVLVDMIGDMLKPPVTTRGLDL